MTLILTKKAFRIIRILIEAQKYSKRIRKIPSRKKKKATKMIHRRKIIKSKKNHKIKMRIEMYNVILIHKV